MRGSDARRGGGNFLKNTPVTNAATQRRERAQRAAAISDNGFKLIKHLFKLTASL